MSGAFPASVRKAVYVRAWFACERDGRTDGLQVHHRRARGMGGTDDPVARSAANALLLCHTCHGWVESNRAAAARLGWLVAQGHDPAPVPALVYERGPVLLGTDGQYHPTTTRRTA